MYSTKEHETKSEKHAILHIILNAFFNFFIAMLASRAHLTVNTIQFDSTIKQTV